MKETDEEQTRRRISKQSTAVSEREHKPRRISK